MASYRSPKTLCVSSAKKYISNIPGRYYLPKNDLLIFWEIALDDVFQDKSSIFLWTYSKGIGPSTINKLYNGFLSEEIEDMHQNTISSIH